MRYGKPSAPLHRSEIAWDVEPARPDLRRASGKPEKGEATHPLLYLSRFISSAAGSSSELLLRRLGGVLFILNNRQGIATTDPSSAFRFSSTSQ